MGGRRERQRDQRRHGRLGRDVRRHRPERDLPEVEPHDRRRDEAKRDRVLLLNKKELKKLLTRGEEKGLTIVPLALFISERGFAKLEIGLAQGKKTYDKRETLKERDTKVELDRAMKR